MQSPTECYVEAFIIVDGAEEDNAVFGCEHATEMEAWLNIQKESALAAPNMRTEIYLIEHGHSPDVEDCSCVQYLTDHKPYWAYGGSVSG